MTSYKQPFDEWKTCQAVAILLQICGGSCLCHRLKVILQIANLLSIEEADDLISSNIEDCVENPARYPIFSRFIKVAIFDEQDTVSLGPQATVSHDTEKIHLVTLLESPGDSFLSDGDVDILTRVSSRTDLSSFPHWKWISGKLTCDDYGQFYCKRCDDRKSIKLLPDNNDSYSDDGDQKFSGLTFEQLSAYIGENVTLQWDIRNNLVIKIFNNKASDISTENI